MLSLDPRLPLCFSPDRGRAVGGHFMTPRPSPVRGKTTQPLAVPLEGIAALFAADGAGEGPGEGMEKARPGGLARSLRVRSPDT
jgi:hypothetical protein